MLDEQFSNILASGRSSGDRRATEYAARPVHGCRAGWLAARALGIALTTLTLAGCQAVPPRPIDADAAASARVERTLADPGLAQFASEVLGARTPAPGEAWEERALVTAALWAQPRVALAAAGARRARAAIESARSLPNPTLSLAPEYSVNPAQGESPWSPALQLSWPIATAGKRGDRVDRATAEALAAHYTFAAEVAAVERDVRLAYVELCAARDAAAALEAEAAAQDALIAAWQKRVELGAASHAEAAPARAAALEVTSQLAAARTRERGARAALAAAIGVPAARLDEIDLAPVSAAALPDAGQDATRSALAARADVLAALASYAASEAALQLEVAKQFPDLLVGPGYQWDQGQSKWQVGVSLELPLLNRNRGPIGEAVAERALAAARVESVQARALAEIEAALAARDGAAAERDALRESEATLSAQAGRAETALRLGSANRVDALSARVLALRSRRAAREAELRAASAQIALAAALQRSREDLERLERLGVPEDMP